MSESHSTDFAVQLELAWAAGFFDGEGCTYLTRVSHRRDWNRLAASVAQSELAPLHRFWAAVGLGRVTGPYTDPKKPNTKPQWRWTCAGFPAKEVLKLLWPYLTEIKKAQAERAMAGEVNSGKPTARNRTHCPKGHDYSVHAVRRADGGGRRCRICLREQERVKMQKWRAKRKARLAAEQITEGERDGRDVR